MICADVSLAKFTNYQPHDAPISYPLLRYAVRRPVGDVKDHHQMKTASTEQEGGREMTFLINRLRVETQIEGRRTDGLIKFSPGLYADVSFKAEDSLKLPRRCYSGRQAN